MLFKKSWFGEWVATREMHVLKSFSSFSSFEMSFNVDIKLHPPLRIFEQLKK